MEKTEETIKYFSALNYLEGAKKTCPKDNVHEDRQYACDHTCFYIRAAKKELGDKTPGDTWNELRDNITAIAESCGNENNCGTTLKSLDIIIERIKEKLKE
jgi:hypothetical protein